MPNTFTFSTHYGSRAGIEGWYGTGNLAGWADLNASGIATEITAQIEKGLTYADNLIDLLAAEAGVTPTLTSAALGTARYNLIVNLANELAGAWLYFNRGELDDRQGLDGKMTEHLMHSEGSPAGNWRDGMIWKVLSQPGVMDAAQLLAPIDLARGSNGCCMPLQTCAGVYYPYRRWGW